MNRPSVRAWILLALIFVVGGVTGAAITMVSFPLWHNTPGEQQRRAHWMAELTRRLSLTPQQQAQISPIVEDAERQIQAVHRDELGRVGGIFADAYAKMTPVLTAQQQPILADMQRESQRHGFVRFRFHKRDDGAPMVAPGANAAPPP